MDTGETRPQTAELGIGQRWTFGPAVLDERTLELTVKGELVTIERKPLEVLLYLLHHAGEVVTKDDLAENVWPGRILTETVLTRCISQARQVLGDDDKTLIRTVHGFGYRLVADVRVEAATSAAPLPKLDFKPGDHPPLRPQWKLVERLGSGGHGEAWLARHAKTNDARVFKFALDAGALTSLKREITLYRLLRDSLGARAAVARILEWNLEEAPYFIEMEHVAGGNLQAWCEAQGGVSAIPLTQRLELVAQIGEALAAAHSVGALHKDLKPGNVLVHVENGVPVIRLCDFGSGGVLDPQRLEALGITRMGFTKTLTQGTTSATPLYLAPEVIAGQPFTVQADIYALGVLLYQVVTGDLRKPLAPGWEADVEDELLREDIAAAAAGNPAKRLTDALQIVERLRSLGQRRESRLAASAARERAERAKKVMAELRRTRVYATALLALTAAAVAGGFTAYKARNAALAATATAVAVRDFLTEDVLRLDAGLFRPSEASYESLLDRAASEAGGRLKDQPEAAADIHWLLGRRYQELGHLEKAITQYEKATSIYPTLYGPASEPNLMALDRLAWVYLEAGRTSDALGTLNHARELWQSRLDSKNLAMLMARVRLVRTQLTAGDYTAADRELRAVISEISTANPSTKELMPLLKQWLGVAPPVEAGAQIVTAYANLILAGNVLEETGDNDQEAESRLRDARTTFSRVLGNHSELTALASFTLSAALALTGKYQEAEAHIRDTAEYFEKSLPPRHFARGLSKVVLGRLRIEQGRFDEATKYLQQSVEGCRSDGACPSRLLAEFHWNLGLAQTEADNAAEAVISLQEAQRVGGNLGRSDNVVALRMRVALATALDQAGRPKEASDVLNGIQRKAITDLRKFQLARAELRRIEGLLHLRNQNFSEARAALADSLEIIKHRYGAGHWRTNRAQMELNSVRT